MKDLKEKILKGMPKPHLRVFLFRHGEVERAKDMRMNGHIDVRLSNRGERQMLNAARALAKRPISAVYSSDLYRAKRGGEITAKLTGRKLKINPALREMNFGELEGLAWKEAVAKMGGDVARLLNWKDNRFPGGENLIDFSKRVMPVYKKIIARESGELALFAHGGTNRIIIYSEFNLGLDNFFMFEQSFACVNIIDYYEMGMKVLRLLNGGAHCIKNFKAI
jgi:alpha-ribazole phosphatase